MKTICIDAGNTFVKVALADEGRIQSLASFALVDTSGLLHHIASLPQADACILSSVSIVELVIMDTLLKLTPFFLELTADTPIPIQNLYKTPETLGKDRLAAVIGAHRLHPGKNILVLDAGTALTIDFIDNAGNYHGGNISPGLKTRYRALHDYTKRLPLQSPADDYMLLGNTTETAITAGVQNGIIFEAMGYIHHFAKQYPDLIVVLTGGDGIFFANKIEWPIFAEPNLVFVGLEKIIEYNLGKK